MTPSDSPSPLSELSTLLQAAVALHQQGHLAQAEGVYKKVLASYPEQADAWHLLGVLAHQREKHEEAVALIERAISIYPSEGQLLQQSWSGTEAAPSPAGCAGELRGYNQAQPDPQSVQTVTA